MPIRLKDGNHGNTRDNVAKIPAPQSGRKFVTCSHPRSPQGFGIRITAPPKPSKRNPEPREKRVYMLRCNLNDQQRWYQIGEVGTWTLESARAKAREMRMKVDQGICPITENDNSVDELTTKDFVAAYLQGSRIQGLASKSDIEGYFYRDVIPSFGDLPIKNITKQMIRDVVRKKAALHPNAGKKLLIFIKQFFYWAENEDLINNNPAISMRPKDIEAKKTKTSRKRTLNEDELRAFMAHVGQSGATNTTNTILLLILLTGQRPGEVAKMRRGDINLEEKSWTIPAEHRRKTETKNVVPLSDWAAEVITRAIQERDRLPKSPNKETKTDYIFESTQSNHQSVNSLSKAIRRMRRELRNQYEHPWGHWTPHDLRRTMRTGLSMLGVAPHVAELAIGHTKMGMEAVYDMHHFLPEIRSAQIGWADYLLNFQQDF